MEKKRKNTDEVVNPPSWRHATLLLCNGENFSTPDNPWRFSISIALFVATFVGTKWVKINPIRMICYAALAGLLLLY